MQVTLKDIAARSGYSVTTVSRALGGHDDVNEQTRAHILAIADELQYQPNAVARQLQARRTFTIGLVAPPNLHSHEDGFFSVLVKGVGYTAANYQYDLLLSTQRLPQDEREAYRRIAGGNRVDGMILARTYRQDWRIDYLRSIGIPFVVSGRLAPDETTDFPYIDVDSQAGIRTVVTYFTGCGHRRIGLILPPEDIAFTPYRHRGYQQGLEEAGIAYEPAYVATGDLTREGGAAAAAQLLRTAPGLTAIVACNDWMAIGAIDAIRARGLQPGVDVAVSGFDDIPVAAHIDPPLTTVHQPIYQIGEQLAEMLIKIIAGEFIEHTSILLEPTLVVRESGGPPGRRP